MQTLTIITLIVGLCIIGFKYRLKYKLIDELKKQLSAKLINIRDTMVLYRICNDIIITVEISHIIYIQSSNGVKVAFLKYSDNISSFDAARIVYYQNTNDNDILVNNKHKGINDCTNLYLMNKPFASADLLQIDLNKTYITDELGSFVSMEDQLRKQGYFLDKDEAQNELDSRLRDKAIELISKIGKVCQDQQRNQ